MLWKNSIIKVGFVWVGVIGRNMFRDLFIVLLNELLNMKVQNTNNPSLPPSSPLHLLFSPGDLERQQDMPITFGFDRNNPIPQTKFQMGFIKVIVSPLYSTFSRLPGICLDHCVDSLLRNNEKWNSLSAFDAAGSGNPPN